MITASIIIAVIACIGVAREWHLYRIADAVERAVIIERRRVSAYLRRESLVEQDAYTASLLSDLATEIAEREHHRVQS